MGYKSNGYVQLRRGLYENVRKGKISFSAASLYAAMIVDADTDNGVCHGSAGLFSVVYGIPSRSVRESLEELDRGGYIKRFPVRGKHGSYPILINKFECTSGAMIGMRLDADNSTSYDDLKFINRHDSGNDDVNESVNDGGNDTAVEVSMMPPEDREREIKKKKKDTTHAREDHSQFSLPLWIDPEAWSGFEEMRKKIRAPLTDRARNGILSELHRIGGNPNAILDQSTRNSWRGVFPMKDAVTGVQQKPKITIRSGPVGARNE